MNPRETLIHVTSFGENAVVKSGSTHFQNYSKAPMKDINKVGLVHYAVPKIMDHLDANNNTFYINFEFAADSDDSKAGNMGNEVDIRVELPLLDYYSVKDATVSDQHHSTQKNLHSGTNEESFDKDRHDFEEILQTTINRAIIDKFDRIMNPHIQTNDRTPTGYDDAATRYQCLSRLNCIVEFNYETGVYDLFFGYRGAFEIQHANGLSKDGPFVAAGTKDPVTGLDTSNAIPKEPSYIVDKTKFQHYTGMPCDLGDGKYHGAVAPLLSNGGEGYFKTPTHDYNGHRCWKQNVRATPAIEQQMTLTSVGIYGLSPRLQLMFGARSASIYGTAVNLDVKTRGWVALLRYTTANNNLLPIIKIEMEAAPDLEPPSFLIMQLTTQGTRSKILGHEDEKGGWAIPTAPGEYASNYKNNIGQFYPLFDHNRQFIPVRVTPNFMADGHKSIQQWREDIAWPADAVDIWDGFGYDYDPIPPGGYGGNSATGNGNNFWGMNTLFDFSNTSKHIMFRNLRTSGNKIPVSARTKSGFRRESGVFTVSMIQPQYVHTQMDDATIQTIDVRLLWGDTATPCFTSTSLPTQASFIVGP